MQRLKVRRATLYSFRSRLHERSVGRASLDKEVVDSLKGQATCFREEEVNDRDKNILDEPVSIIGFGYLSAET